MRADGSKGVKMGLTESALSTILDRELPMIAPGDHVLVAVSGGPDSLALLHLLIALREKLGMGWLGVAHADHRLRGSDSDADRAFVERFCAEREIPCTVQRIDVDALRGELGAGTEEAARVGRYRFLEETAGRGEATKIATAHTQDDRIETVLLHILRGTGLEGLKGIPYQRGPYIRPFLDTPRSDVELYCVQNGLSPRIDATNSDPDAATRNRIRHDLLPKLEREYNAGVRRALLGLSTIAARDAEHLSAAASEMLAELSEPIKDGGLRLRAEPLLSASPSLQRYILREAIETVRGTLDSISSASLDAILSSLAKNEPFCWTTPPPHARILVKAGEVKVVRGSGGSSNDVSLHKTTQDI